MRLTIHLITALTQRHRFSVDCDVVIPKASRPGFGRIVVKEGYEKSVEKQGFDQVYGGEFVSFSKKVGDFPMTVDLLVGSLVSRQTGGVWSYDYIKEYSSHGVVAGIEKSVETTVAEKELLVALKIHSGRETDLRDIVIFRENWVLRKSASIFRKATSLN